MTIYISTGGFKELSADKTSEKFFENGITEIELSGGVYEPNLIENLSNLINRGMKFQLHNYFPPPEKPFVLNLASNDTEIQKLSLNHVFKAIQSCGKLKSNTYSFHSGFLCDFKVSEIGKKINKRALYNREKSKNIFQENIIKISEVAKKNGINIMIENNVLSRKNIEEFKGNPFLMCDPEETKEIAKNLPNNVSLLVDVAHLKISSNSLNFKIEDFFSNCNSFIKGYHLSDNDGLSDTNGKISKNSWFWNYLNKDLNYYSLEIYKESFDVLNKTKNLCSEILNKKN